jgi:hypothetical protein
VEYAVEHVGAVDKSSALSLLTNPEYEGEIDGLVPPYVTVGEDAVTVSGAFATVKP